MGNRFHNEWKSVGTLSIHYHGLPIYPYQNLQLLIGKNFCINYRANRGRYRMLAFARRYSQSTMFDNGAYGVFRSGGVITDWSDYYDWIEPYLGHPNWAVLPDRIDGSVADQRALVDEWPFPKNLGAPVWHLALPIDYLLELADGWPRICLGSSGAYWQIGTDDWKRRMDEAFTALYRRRIEVPWVHGLRMLAQLGERWPLASADSVNVARNHKSEKSCPGCMANAIDTVNSPVQWDPGARGASVARLLSRRGRLMGGSI